MRTVPDTELQAENDDGCVCPRCHYRIPEQFYCDACGYVPDWRQREYEACRKAA